MPSPPDRRPATRVGTAASLVSGLRDLLRLEAPHLLERVDDGASPEELEGRLLEAIRAPAESLGEPAAEIFPGTSVEEAVTSACQRLEIVVRGFFRRREIAASIRPDEKRTLLRTMILTRRLDTVLKQAFDRREIRWRDYPSPQKGFRSLGQEAIVGAALRLRRPPEYPPGREYAGDYISPLIRDLGALLMFKPDPLHVLLVQYGKVGTPVGGRDLHVGDFESGVLVPAAPLTIGTQTAIGLSYAHKLRGEDRVSVSFIGDGGASLGEWHEAINFAAVERLGMVFVIENNHWALGTHVSEQTAADRFALRAAGYGIPGVTLFGTDPEEIAAAVAWAADRARTGAGPALLELVTYRRPGHAHHDDDRFHGNPEIKVPGYELEEERAVWEAHDPIDLYRDRLLAEEVVSESDLDEMTATIDEEIDTALEAARAADWPDPVDYRREVYAPRRLPVPHGAPDPPTKAMSYDEAVRQALTEMMEEDDGVFVLGEDVGGRYGGAFGVTRGLAKRFGEERCLNTPLAESAIVGCAVGAALAGARPVAEMQFADFLATGFNALVNNAAKLYWRWRRPVPMVVRLPYGGATGTMNRLLGGGPYHSQCPEMWFVRTPGWKVVAPATPSDAKGLMLAAIRDDNPVIFLEAKGLYGFFRNDLREEVPLGSEHEVPLGRAAIRRRGDDLTLVTYGAMVWTALEAADRLEEEGIDVEVIDLRSLVPLDETTLTASVEKTHRVLVLHEDTRRGGMGGEIAALLNERVFYHLDAPVRRVTAPDTPVPS
ncbi:MAG: dehydrogenase E1 component subunit alpha/beta, partial [Thermoanaerobaculia bacterium]|nr:dehydrogenase E1 component subunit alpha/beta [Thermoanaerobaculia bacterium]